MALSGTLTSSTSSRRALIQRSSWSSRSDWKPASSISRTGSIIEYGMVTCRSPPPPSSSMWKVETTTASLGPTMLAIAGLTSEFMYSKLTGMIACQASLRSTNA
ncbi:hypothetical protein D9M73_215060 [compost metagenome]